MPGEKQSKGQRRIGEDPAPQLATRASELELSIFVSMMFREA